MVKFLKTKHLKPSVWNQIKAGKDSYIMMFPFMLFFLVFTVIPILAAVLLSFTDFNMLEIPSFIGWENYSRLFMEDEVFLKALKNTLILALINGPLGYIVAFFVAWLINELNSKIRVIVTLIFYAPSISRRPAPNSQTVARRFCHDLCRSL